MRVGGSAIDGSSSWANLRRCGARLLFPQNANDVLFAEPALLFRPSPFWRSGL